MTHAELLWPLLYFKAQLQLQCSVSHLRLQKETLWEEILRNFNPTSKVVGRS